MFRAMRRGKQQISEAECREILRQEKRAAFSVIGDDGYPYTVPINFYYDEAHGAIYFHGAKTGHKAEAMGRCDKVCLTVWNHGFHQEGHWEWNVSSVVVFGRVKPVHDRDLAAQRLRQLAEKYYPTREEIDREMSGSAMDRVALFSIEIEHMTGKLVNER